MKYKKKIKKCGCGKKMGGSSYGKSKAKQSNMGRKK